MIDYILICIAFVLAITELLLGSFYIIFFAFGFLFTGILGLLFDINVEIKIFLCAFISFCTLYIFKKFFKKTQNVFNNDFLDESGIGVVKDRMIYFKGSYWQVDEIDKFNEGDKIKIKGVENNKLIIDLD